MTDLDIAFRFGTAIAIGMLLGLERERSKSEQGGLGVRTFSLIALTGATAGYLDEQLGLYGFALGLFLAAAWAVGLPESTTRALGRTGEGLLAAVAIVVLFGLLPLSAAGLGAMRGSVEWFIAARYLVAKRRQVFISAITTGLRDSRCSSSSLAPART